MIFRPLRITAIAVVILAALSIAHACATVRTEDGAEMLAVVGATVVDPSSSQPPATDQTILISDGVIRAVGPSSAISIPAGARRVDARGKYAIPGLWDAHVHFMNTGVTALPLFIANGVTSVREMGGYIDSTRAWQARMRKGNTRRTTHHHSRSDSREPALSPGCCGARRSRKFAAGAAGASVPHARRRLDRSEARHRFPAQAARGLCEGQDVRESRDVLRNLREARRAGLRIAAHQQSAPLRSALDSGLTDLQHGILPPLSSLSAATRDSIYQKFVDNGAWYTPTLTVSRAVMISGDSAARAIFGAEAIRLDERRAYASPWLLGWWRMQVDERIADSTAIPAATLEGLYRSSADDVHRMHELGVKIPAGTDAGSVLVYPGFGLHEELRRLVEDARLSPRDALWSATIGPAQFARLDDRLGTISAGKLADIVLLDADPLSDIRNTRRIFAVVKGGRLFSRVELDALLAGVRSAVAH